MDLSGGGKYLYFQGGGGKYTQIMMLAYNFIHHVKIYPWSVSINVHNEY